jgi:hypothetical protein
MSEIQKNWSNQLAIFLLTLPAWIPVTVLLINCSVFSVSSLKLPLRSWGEGHFLIKKYITIVLTAEAIDF